MKVQKVDDEVPVVTAKHGEKMHPRLRGVQYVRGLYGFCRRFSGFLSFRLTIVARVSCFFLFCFRGLAVVCGSNGTLT